MGAAVWLRAAALAVPRLLANPSLLVCYHDIVLMYLQTVGMSLKPRDSGRSVQR